jgi:tetratricopeptide (TPR) repeat protein
LFQPLSAPYDLSATSEFANIVFPELRLYAPNFTGVTFRNIKLPNAKLPAASFTKSVFVSEGGKINDFGSADLERSQFRGAEIASTSFQGADLFRAVFDRAVLREVDFAGANLRAASFWATTLDQPTRLGLQAAAWWLAVGWPWSEIQNLHASLTDMDETKHKVRLSFLKNSQGFKKDMKEPTSGLQRSLSGSLEKARALNWIAWTYAVWGLCISEPDGARPGIEWYPELCTKDPPTVDFPRSAREAALRAVQIVTELTAASGKDAANAEFLANLKDTLAYVYMQSGEMPKALETFKEIEKDSPPTFEAAETTFRYAIAQYNQGEQAAAVERFEKAIFEKRYQPTHELQTLKTYIFGNQKFESCLEESTELLWPTNEFLSPRGPGAPKPHAQKQPGCRKSSSAP